MTQLTLRDVSKSYGADPLFRSITLAVGADERIGLIGANGSGKSTLLCILAGLVEPDNGERTVQKGLRLGYLPQEDDLDPALTVEETVAAPLHDAGLDPAELYTRVGVALGKAGFDDRKQQVGKLSGGQRKRVALARELAKEPDILLLDEPTNHLDLETILWLENFLLSLSKGFVVVSHDRWFLEHVTTRTIELGRCYPEGYLSVDAPYSDFLEKRIEFLESQACLEATLANKVRREVEWLRRGPKARTTKAKYRKDEAARLQEQLAETRKLNADPGPAGIDFTATERKTKRLLVARSVSKTMGDKTLFQDLDVVLSPGNRLGLVGLNGSGKTTLLRVLAGELEPDTGTVKRAPDLQLAVFDQNRERLDPDQPLRRALAPEGDTVLYRGRPLHVASWAKRFLFSPEQLPLPVGELSGGEQARIYIARLMVRPADVLMLDEPTNDLDIPTLEVLEDSLIDFPGAVVLITHDRFFLDRVATHVLGLDPEAEGEDRAAFFGDYAQWEQARKKTRKARAKAYAKTAKPKEKQPKPKSKQVKLSYKEQREWDGMEEAIQNAEARLESCQTALEDPAVAADAAKLTELAAAHEDAQREVDQLYTRWEELEAKQQPSQ